MSSADRTGLLDRFRDYCRDHNLSAERAASLTGLSKATVQQVFQGKGADHRSNTLARIRAFMDRVAAPELSDADMFRLIGGRMHIFPESVERTLEIYSGSYVAYRLTPTNNSLLASRLDIRALSKDEPLPFFFEDLAISEEGVPGEAGRHKFAHHGPVFYREGRIYLLSVALGNMREMIFKAPMSSVFSQLRGLVLTVSAAREPYSTRVLLKRHDSAGIEQCTGTFSLDDLAVADVLPYVVNESPHLEPLKVK